MLLAAVLAGDGGGHQGGPQRGAVLAVRQDVGLVAEAGAHTFAGVLHRLQVGAGAGQHVAGQVSQHVALGVAEHLAEAGVDVENVQFRIADDDRVVAGVQRQRQQPHPGIAGALGADVAHEQHLQLAGVLRYPGRAHRQPARGAVDVAQQQFVAAAAVLVQATGEEVVAHLGIDQLAERISHHLRGGGGSTTLRRCG